MIISFGVLSEAVSTQLRNRGIKVSIKDGKLIDKAADSITYLNVYGFLTEKETKRAQNRLIKHIEKLYTRRK